MLFGLQFILTCAVLAQVASSWVIKSSLSRLPRCQSISILGGAEANEWELKRYPADFIVIEDGCLCDFEAAEKVEAGRTDQGSTEADAGENDKTDDNFKELLSKEQIESLDSINGDEGCIDSTVIEITPSLTKVQRTLFHQQFIRNEYPRLDSKTETGGSTESTCILIYRKGARSIEVDQDEGGGGGESMGANSNDSIDKSRGKRKGKGKRKAVVQRWDNSRPDYLHFTIHKHLMTTDEALDLLAKKTGCLPTRFAVSGSKDRFAVTAQRVSAWRVERKKLDDYIEDTQKRRESGMSVQVDLKDIAVGSRPLSLGALRGNTFSLRLRPKTGSDIASEEEQVSSLAASLRSLEGTVPFLNLFGPQRFGNPLPVNVAVGKAILQEDYRKAVLLLLLVPGSAVEAEMAGGVGALAELGSWLSPPEQESLVPFLQRHWDAYAQAILLQVSQSIDKEGVSRPLEGLESRIEFLSALLGVADLPTGGHLETPKAFPFAQKKLLDNILTQLQLQPRIKKGRGRGKDEEEGDNGDNGEEEQDSEDEEGERARVAAADLLRVDFKKAFSQALGRNLRLLFVNAYQSDMFNRRAEETLCRGVEVAQGGHAAAVQTALTMSTARAREGDLVLVDGSGTPLTAWDVSERNISMIGNAVPSFEKAHSGTSKPRQAYYRVTTSAEEQAGTYGLENVVAVLPGYATAPSPWIEEHLRRDGCSGLLEGRHSDGMYRLPGTYRHVVSLARNFRAAEGPLFYSEERREVMRGAEAAPAKSYSDTVEDMYSDGSLGSMVRGMRKSMARRGDSENQPEGEGEGEAAVEVLFSLCASSYATSFVASLLGSPLGQK